MPVNPKLNFLWAGLLLALLVLIAPAAAQPAMPLLGFHVGRGDAAHLAAARFAGASFGVVVFSWADIEPEPGYLYWEVPDAALRAADFYDLQIVARLDRPPDWATTDRGPTPWNLEAYANFVSRVVERYGNRLAGIIIWNEPNTALEWSGESPDPAGYVAMLKAAYPAAKAVNPDLPVLLAGLAFTPGDANNINDLEYLQQLYDAGAGAYFDILAAHPYGFGRPPGDSPDADQLNFRRVELHRQIMVANGDEAKPVWVTEMGWRTSAPNPADEWQVVNPRQQASYTQQAVAYAARSYPWLERLAFWELNAAGDDYGYYLWHGPAETSFAYEALVAECQRFNPACRTDPATLQPAAVEAETSVPILAPDVIIRLGDRATLHPHWVHLHGGGENFSPAWQGEFFLTTAQANRSYNVLLELMQVDQPNNRVRLNGVELGYLATRTRPDPTSTWVSQRFELPVGLARPGVNTLEIAVGPRNPAHQYGFWRWENMQFRRARLAPAERPPAALISDWTPQPSPSGWSEAIRLRPGAAADFWLMGNRRGQIWRGDRAMPALQNEAGNMADRLFTDVLPTGQGELVATDRGLLWRTDEASEWQAVVGGPAAFAYVVRAAGDRFYAGFEAAGVWSAPDLAGFWQPAGLADQTVLDLAYDPNSQRLYAATAAGVFVRRDAGNDWDSLPALPGKSENTQAAFSTRLFLSQDGEPVVRSQDRLWRWSEAEEARLAFGPAELSQANKIYAVLDCCGPGSLVASRYEGLWQLDQAGEWQRLDGDNTFGLVNATDLLRIENKLYAAGMVGLFGSVDGGESWQKVDGLPATVTDLLVDPVEPARWLAGTPAGVYRSDDRGASWRAVSPPWTVWDMAFGADGRLFVAHARGVAWTDGLGSSSPAWSAARGLEGVLFFSVNPHPTDPDLLWSGAWGNDIGVSADGGQTLASLGNGLETLSILDVLWHPTPGQVTVGTIEGLYRTDDAGASWFKLPGPLSQQTVYDLLQTGDGAIWAGAADGLWVSADYGVNWTRIESIPLASVLRLGQFTDAAGELWLWAGTEADGLWLSADGGQTWVFGGLAGRTVYQLLADPAQSERLVAATEQGIFAASLPAPIESAN